MTRAIDVHVHPPNPSGESLTSSKEAQQYFRTGPPPASAQEVAEYYASLDMMAVVFDIDSETATGRPPTPNDYFGGLMEQHPKQFIGFGSVDPWKGRAAIKEAHRCAELGLRGLKFMPNMQQFYANDERFYPLWGTAQELGLVVLFHTGTTGVGAGRPGGGGIKLKFSRPIPYVDDVAADFPDLRIIMAHPSWPWQEEQLAMLVHKPNVYMDLSGWSPKYFHPSLVQYAKTLIQDKVLFGSDYPVINPERWLRDFDGLGFAEDVRRKILLADHRPRALLLLALGGLRVAAKEDAFEERPVVVVVVDEDGNLPAGPHAFGAGVFGADVNVDRRLTVEHRAHGYRVWLAIGAGSRYAADPRFAYELLDCLGKRSHLG